MVYLRKKPGLRSEFAGEACALMAAVPGAAEASSGAGGAACETVGDILISSRDCWDDLVSWCMRAPFSCTPHHVGIWASSAPAAQQLRHDIAPACSSSTTAARDVNQGVSISFHCLSGSGTWGQPVVEVVAEYGAATDAPKTLEAAPAQSAPRPAQLGSALQPQPGVSQPDTFRVHHVAVEVEDLQACVSALLAQHAAGCVLLRPDPAWSEGAHHKRSFAPLQQGFPAKHFDSIPLPAPVLASFHSQRAKDPSTAFACYVVFLQVPGVGLLELVQASRVHTPPPLRMPPAEAVDVMLRSTASAPCRRLVAGTVEVAAVARALEQLAPPQHGSVVHVQSASATSWFLADAPAAGSCSVALVFTDGTPRAAALSQAVQEWTAASRSRGAAAHAMLVECEGPAVASSEDPGLHLRPLSDGVSRTHWSAIAHSAGMRSSCVFNHDADTHTALPFSPEFSQTAALWALRASSAVTSRSASRLKVVAVDADNTLWQGALADCDAPAFSGLALAPQHVALQRTLLSLRDGGVLLVLVTKNNLADVSALFDAVGKPHTCPPKLQGMSLHLEHFVLVKASWADKGQGLADALAQLGQAPANTVFIDDSPVEIASVNSSLPGVSSVLWPQDTGTAMQVLSHLWFLDYPPPVGSDAAPQRRQAAYAAAAQHRKEVGEVMKSGPSDAVQTRLAAFFAALQPRVRVSAEASSAVLKRAARLFSRANQFLSDKRHISVQYLENKISSGYRLHSAGLSDRFGDVGEHVAFALAGVRPGGVAAVELFVLSCRAMGRGVEYALLSHVARCFETHASKVVLHGQASGRNVPFLDFLRALASRVPEASLDEQASGTLALEMPAAALADFVYTGAMYAEDMQQGLGQGNQLTAADESAPRPSAAHVNQAAMSLAPRKHAAYAVRLPDVAFYLQGSHISLGNCLPVEVLNVAEARFVWAEVCRAPPPSALHEVQDVPYSAVLSRLPTGAVVWDVGANIGLFTLACMAASDAARITAVEPLPEAFRALLQNTKCWKEVLDFQGALTVFDCAALSQERAGPTVSQVSFVKQATASILSHVQGHSTGDEADVAAEWMGAQLGPAASHDAHAVAAQSLERTSLLQVPASSLSFLWHLAGRPDLTLLKVDVEGSEAEALRGCSAEMLEHTQVIIVEVHFAGVARDDRFKAIAANLRAAGFLLASAEPQPPFSRRLCCVFAKLHAVWLWGQPRVWHAHSARAVAAKACVSSSAPQRVAPRGERMPGSPSEQLMLEAWGAALANSLSASRASDWSRSTFVEAGGDSLCLVQLLSEARLRGMTLDISHDLMHMTPAQMVASCGQRSEEVVVVRPPMQAAVRESARGDAAWRGRILVFGPLAPYELHMQKLVRASVRSDACSLMQTALLCFVHELSRQTSTVCNLDEGALLLHLCGGDRALLQQLDGVLQHGGPPPELDAARTIPEGVRLGAVVMLHLLGAARLVHDSQGEIRSVGHCIGTLAELALEYSKTNYSFTRFLAAGQASIAAAVHFGAAMDAVHGARSDGLSRHAPLAHTPLTSSCRVGDGGPEVFTQSAVHAQGAHLAGRTGPLSLTLVATAAADAFPSGAGLQALHHGYHTPTNVGVMKKYVSTYAFSGAQHILPADALERCVRRLAYSPFDFMKRLQATLDSVKGSAPIIQEMGPLDYACSPIFTPSLLLGFLQGQECTRHAWVRGPFADDQEQSVLVPAAMCASVKRVQLRSSATQEHVSAAEVGPLALTVAEAALELLADVSASSTVSAPAQLETTRLHTTWWEMGFSSQDMPLLLQRLRQLRDMPCMHQLALGDLIQWPTPELLAKHALEASPPPADSPLVSPPQDNWAPSVSGVSLSGCGVRIGGLRHLKELWSDATWRGAAAALIAPEDVKGVFGLSSPSKDFMDPQQVLALAAVQDALSESGLCARVDPERVGVWVGVQASDWKRARQPRGGGMHGILGSTPSAIASRVCTVFSFGGPAVAVDAACGSSSSALEAALNAMHTNCVDAAVVIGTQVNLAADAERELAEVGVLSATQTTPFAFLQDAEGRGGFIRRQAVVALVLERGKQSVIELASTASGFVGQTGAMHVVDADRYAAVVRRAHQRAGIQAGDVAHVEAHATGTSVGDASELRGLSSDFPDAHPSVASSKGLLGHTEACSGALSLAFARECMLHGLPPHMEVLRSRAWKLGPQPCTTAASGPPQVVGVSNIGLTGTMTHIILKRRTAALGNADTTAHVLPLGCPAGCALGGVLRQARDVLCSTGNVQPLTELATAAWQRWRTTCATATCIFSSTHALTVDAIVSGLEVVMGALPGSRSGAAKQQGVQCLWRTQAPSRAIVHVQWAPPHSGLQVSNNWNSIMQGGVLELLSALARVMSRLESDTQWDATALRQLAVDCATALHAHAFPLIELIVDLLQCSCSVPSSQCPFGPAFLGVGPGARSLPLHLHATSRLALLAAMFAVALYMSDFPLSSLADALVCELLASFSLGDSVRTVVQAALEESLPATQEAWMQPEKWQQPVTFSFSPGQQQTSHDASDAWEELVARLAAQGPRARPSEPGRDLLVSPGGWRVFAGEEAVPVPFPAAAAWMGLCPASCATKAAAPVPGFPPVPTWPSAELAHPVRPLHLLERLPRDTLVTSSGMDTTLALQVARAAFIGVCGGGADSVARVEEVLGATHTPYVDALGWDSLQCSMLPGTLELEQDKLGHMAAPIQVPPTIAFDAPTVQELIMVLSGSAQQSLGQQVPRSLSPSIGLTAVGISGLALRLGAGTSKLSDFASRIRNGQAIASSATLPQWKLRCMGQAAVDGLVPCISLCDSDVQPLVTSQPFIDPHHSIMQRVAQEALEDGGLWSGVSGWSQGVDPRRVGCVIGCTNSDFVRTAVVQSDHSAPPSFASGSQRAMIAGKVQRAFGCGGPAMVVDTACSSGLVALSLALRMIQQDEADFVIVGAVNLVLAAAVSSALVGMRVLSSTGACRTLEADADGYARADGCVAMVLARADAGPQYALVDSVHLNHNGSSASLTAPNGSAQRRLLEAAWTHVPAPAHVELHGSGTKLGDAIEVQALASSLAGARSVLGASKRVFGHTEGAAGLVGVLSSILALHGVFQAMPPPDRLSEDLKVHMDIDEGTGHLSLGGGMAASVVHAQPAAHSGVSSFGFSGTNAHAVLSSARDPRQLSLSVQDMPQRHAALPDPPGGSQTVHQESHQEAASTREFVKAASTEDVQGTLLLLESALDVIEVPSFEGGADEGHRTVCVDAASGKGVLGHVASALLQAFPPHRLDDEASTQVHVLDLAAFNADALAGLGCVRDALRAALLSGAQSIVLLFHPADACQAVAAKVAMQLWQCERCGASELLPAVCVELGSGSPLPILVQLLEAGARKLRLVRAEVSLHLRGGSVRAPRVRGTHAQPFKKRPRLGPWEGKGLVVVGAGAIANAAISAAVQHGCKFVAVLSRHSHTEALQQSHPGCTFESICVDASDASALSLALGTCASWAARHGVRLRSVVHAAGSPHASPLADSDWTAVSSHYALKYECVTALQRFCSTHCVDNLVLTSSCSTLWPLAGYGDYAASHAALEEAALTNSLSTYTVSDDAFSAVLTAPQVVSPRTIVLRLGVVSQGAVAELVEQGLYKRMGVAAIDTATLTEVFSCAMLGESEPLVTLAAFHDCSLFRNVVRLGLRVPNLPLLGGLELDAGAALPANPSPQVDIHEPKEAFVAACRASGLGPEVEQHVAGSSAGARLDPAELGIDSLAAVELAFYMQQECGYPIAPDVFLAPFTLDQLGRSLPVVASQPPTQPPKSAAPMCDPANAVHIHAAACILPGGVETLRDFAVRTFCPVPVFSPAPSERCSHASTQSALPPSGWLSPHQIACIEAEANKFPPAQRSELDPHHLLLLRLASKTLAGVDRSNFHRIGTYVCGGASSFVSSRNSRLQATKYAAMGTAPNFAADQIAHTFGLTGPTMVVDSACASGIAALDIACRHLSSDISDAALVLGANLLLDARSFEQLRHLGVLASESLGDMNSGSAGYVRSEGGVALLLTRTASPSGDLGCIQSVRLGHNPRSDASAITTPSFAGQSSVMDHGAFSHGSILVEAHATGTVAGDAIEAQSLLAAQGGRQDGAFVHAAKRTWGHLEGGAGLLGLLSACVQGLVGLAAPTWPLTYSLSSGQAALPCVSYARSLGHDCAAVVNSFGFGGSVAQATLSFPPSQRPGQQASGEPFTILVLPGQGSVSQGFCQHMVHKSGSFHAFLNAALQEASAASAGVFSAGQLQDLCLVPGGRLPGPPSSWLRAAAVQVMALAASIATGQAAVQALGRLPDVVLGHSLGQLAAAVIAASLPIGGAFRLLFQRLGPESADCTFWSTAMIAVRASSSHVKAVLASAGQHSAQVACINGPSSCTIGCAAGSEEEVVSALQSAGLRHTVLPDVAAYHTEQAASSAGRVLHTSSTGILACTLVTCDGELHAAGQQLPAGVWARLTRDVVNFPAQLRAALSSCPHGHALLLDGSAGGSFHGLCTSILADWAAVPESTGAAASRPTPTSRPEVRVFSLWAKAQREEAATTAPAVPSAWIKAIGQSRLGQAGIAQLPAPAASPLEPRATLPDWSRWKIARDDVRERTNASAVPLVYATYQELSSQLSFLDAGSDPWEVLEDLSSRLLRCLAANIGPSTPEHLSRLLHDHAQDGSAQEAPADLLASIAAQKDVVGSVCMHELSLLEHVCLAAEGLSSGHVAPMDVLFPSGSQALVAPIYSATPRARLMNALLVESASAAVSEAAARSGGPVHVLELGSGTGSLSVPLLHRLNTLPIAHQVHLWLSDISPSLLARLKARLEALSTEVHLHCCVLDVNKAGSSCLDFPAQHMVSVLLASNTLHVASDVPSAWQQLQTFLAPRARVILREVTLGTAFLDCTFGLLPDWQLAAQGHSPGRTSAVLSLSEWQAALRGAELLEVQPRDALRALGGRCAVARHLSDFECVLDFLVLAEGVGSVNAAVRTDHVARPDRSEGAELQSSAALAISQHALVPQGFSDETPLQHVSIDSIGMAAVASVLQERFQCSVEAALAALTYAMRDGRGGREVDAALAGMPSMRPTRTQSSSRHVIIFPPAGVPSAAYRGWREKGEANVRVLPCFSEWATRHPGGAPEAYLQDLHASFITHMTTAGGSEAVTVFGHSLGALLAHRVWSTASQACAYTAVNIIVSCAPPPAGAAHALAHMPPTSSSPSMRWVRSDIEAFVALPEDTSSAPAPPASLHVWLATTDDVFPHLAVDARSTCKRWAAAFGVAQAPGVVWVPSHSWGVPASSPT